MRQGGKQENAGCVNKVNHCDALSGDCRRPHVRRWSYPCGDYSQIQCATTEYASPRDAGGLCNVQSNDASGDKSAPGSSDSDPCLKFVTQPTPSSLVCSFLDCCSVRPRYCLASPISACTTVRRTTAVYCPPVLGPCWSS